MALHVWETELQYCQGVFYLDNEAAKGALIAGATPSDNGSWLVRSFTVREMQCQLKVWFARVPTSSNVADKPSRLDVSELTAEGVSRVTIEWEQLLELIRKFRSVDWGEGERDWTSPTAPVKKESVPIWSMSFYMLHRRFQLLHVFYFSENFCREKFLAKNVNVRNKFLKTAWRTNLTNVARAYNFINIFMVCVVWYVYDIHG